MYPKLFGVIDSYSVLLVIGIVFGVALFEIYFRVHLKEKKRAFYVEICLLVAIALGMVGAYLWQNLYNFIEDPAHFQWSWSMTFYGGLIFGLGSFILLFFMYGRKHYPEGARDMFRIFPASIAGAHAFGRIGCFLAGCCYGLPTQEWFGIQFTTTTEKVIPTNLFEAIFLFLLCGVLVFLAFKKDSDFAMPTYMIVYAIWRFLIEYARGDHRGDFIPGMSPSQFWSLLLFVGGVAYLVLVIVFRQRRRKKLDGEGQGL